MGESFEGKLVRFSSRDAFRKAKHLLHHGELLCCHAGLSGEVRAIFRSLKDEEITRVAVTGFPNGPYACTCSCGEQGSSGLCAHAVAACLHHAKYTIKDRGETPHTKDAPAQYGGLSFTGMPEVLAEPLLQRGAGITLQLEKDFPHVPSKWEKILFSASLTINGRKYMGNLNNLRQLHFDKALSMYAKLSDFPLQDRQIIRFLAINAQQDGSMLTLDAELTAELFHSLAGFSSFLRNGEKIVIHPEIAHPVILVESLPGKNNILHSAIIVNDSPLPLKDVKVINGRSGCWLGMMGEYWWIPARADVGWLRNFLRTTDQNCADDALDKLIAASPNLPFLLIETNGVRLKARKGIPLYQGSFREDGTLELELFFDYGNGVLCACDDARLGASKGRFWKRDTKMEESCIAELLNFGFELLPRRSSDAPRRFLLRDTESIGAFATEYVSTQLAAGREFLLSSTLAKLGQDAFLLRMKAQVVAESDTYFDVKVKLETNCGLFPWRSLVESAGKNESFTHDAKGNFIRIPEELRLLASYVPDILLPRHVPEKEILGGEEILRIPRPGALRWAEIASTLPGSTPLEFLRLQVISQDAEQQDPAVALPESLPFKGNLRNYQKSGVLWMKSMAECRINPILADEMGLGKTVQTLALLAATEDKGNPAPALILCPTTLTENWAREAEKFLPTFRTLVIKGHDRAPLWKAVPSADLVITSYALIKRDVKEAANIRFRYLILDEAQHIKNPATGNARICKSLTAVRKLVLTGTPLENSPEDLWSIVDFLHPGLLGPLIPFRKKFASGNAAQIKGSEKELARRIGPLLLRRKKKDVFTEIPAKTEQVLYCEMDPAQRKYYNIFLRETKEKLAAMEKGEKLNKLELLSSLIRLRQICCDPRLIPEDKRPSSSPPPPSAKMELLREMLMESLDSGHKVLLFSQFTSLLALIKEFLEEKGIPYEYLDGSTKDRFARVENFNNSPEIPLFLLSLKAGGLGLNLTSADTVILCDPWWNPTAEAQAMDRSHRIGQTKNVNCMRLIVKDSVEEKVLALQQKKSNLFERLVENPTENFRNLSLEDFQFLLQ